MNTQNIRTLSTQETRLLNALSAAGKTVFTVEDALVAANGQSANLPRLLSGLTHKRWLLRLERGKYLILPLSAGMEGLYTAHEFVLASRLVEPYAIGYWSALHYHGFTAHSDGHQYRAASGCGDRGAGFSLPVRERCA